MTKSQAGRLGGRATVKKHGRGYMSQIGLKGAQAFWKKYVLKPVNLAHFAIVNRQTNEIVGFTSYSNRSTMQS